MSLQVFETLIQGSDEWLEARAGVLTASVMHQLLTPTLKVAENDTSRGLTATLVSERVTGRPSDSASTWDMRRGTLSEPYARDIYAAEYGPVDEVGFLVRDFGKCQIGYSPDGLPHDGLLEIKSPQAKAHINTLITDRVPSKYFAQLHTGMLVADRPWIDFVSYHPGLPLYVSRVNRDPVWDEAILTAAIAFETNATALDAAYHRAAAGRPATPYVDVFELEEFELR